MLNQFFIAPKHYNMIVLMEKTKSVAISKETIRCKLELERNMINQDMSFSYLRVLSTSNRNGNQQAIQQVIKGSEILGYLRDATWTNKYMTVDSKVKCIKS